MSTPRSLSTPTQDDADSSSLISIYLAVVKGCASPSSALVCSPRAPHPSVQSGTWSHPYADLKASAAEAAASAVAEAAAVAGQTPRGRV